MAGRKSDFTLTKLDDLFSTQEQRDEEKLSKIRDIPLTEIDDFPDHPFKVRDDEDMAQLIESIKERGVIIAVAGMEGALPSVVGGLVDCPVIAVPTSVGYGAAFGGVAALLSMLNSCASGMSVVNIDNGFGAGYLASMINHMD